MIYSFTPFSTEKNFGKAINDCCKIVPNNEDWICIRDGDMMNLTPTWGNIIQDAIDMHGKEYSLFGCWTNRLSKRMGHHQLISDMYDEFDIREHYEEACIWEKTDSISTVPKIAGLFMLFQKKTWIKACGFRENWAGFDSDFCDRVRSNKGKIGLINRLYVFHLYRIWAKGDPKLETKHLMK